MGKHWTEEELSKLDGLKGKSVGEISSELDRSENSVLDKVRAKGWKLDEYVVERRVFPWTEEDVRVLLGLRGGRLDEMCECLGRSKKAVLDRIHLLGWTTNDYVVDRRVRRWTEQEDAVIRERYDSSNRAVVGIAQELGRSRKAVVNRAGVLGVAFKQ